MGHLKIVNFPFVPNGKFIIFRCPKIWAHYSLIIMYLNIGTPNKHHFPFGTNGKVVVLGVPILKHFRVTYLHTDKYTQVDGILEKLTHFWHSTVVNMF